MRVSRFLVFSAIALSCFTASQALAHDGRRFEVSVRDNQLVAQGVNTGPDDGAPFVRPYLNSLHDHWQNSPLGLDSALATLPGFDIPSPSGLLVGHPLYLSLESVSQWVSPPVMPPKGTIPVLTPVREAEVVKVSVGGQSVDSVNPGTILLTPSVSGGGLFDLDLLYEVNRRPSYRIHVLSLQLSSGNPLVQESSQIYVLLSPDGSTPKERLHHTSLFLEENATNAQIVPEPLGFALAAIACSLMLYWQRNRTP